MKTTRRLAEWTKPLSWVNSRPLEVKRLKSVGGTGWAGAGGVTPWGAARITLGKSEAVTRPDTGAMPSPKAGAAPVGLGARRCSLTPGAAGAGAGEAQGARGTKAGAPNEGAKIGDPTVVVVVVWVQVVTGS